MKLHYEIFRELCSPQGHDNLSKIYRKHRSIFFTEMTQKKINDTKYSDCDEMSFSKDVLDFLRRSYQNDCDLLNDALEGSTFTPLSQFNLHEDDFKFICVACGLSLDARCDEPRLRLIIKALHHYKQITSIKVRISGHKRKYVHCAVTDIAYKKRADLIRILKGNDTLSLEEGEEYTLDLVEVKAGAIHENNIFELAVKLSEEPINENK